ncbi:hypothetical protein [Elioraea sp.]|uniref:helix-turn-helix transcriptional regulator n=1 Tax=Elioraea sp. TaxID=2185103 RepID=UPI0025C6382C|nr:hypothetical protein [Elioraea sp.]
MDRASLLARTLKLTEAAFDGASLRGPLTELSHALGAEEALVFFVGADDHWSDVQAMRAAPAVLAEYRTVAPHNPRRAVWAAAPFGVPVTFDTLVPPDSLANGPLGPIMRRTGFPARHICGVRLSPAPGIEARFSIGRNDLRGPFGGETLSAILAIAPHLVVALRARMMIAAHMATTRTAAADGLGEQAGLGDIEALPQPLAVAHGAPQMLNANAALRRLARRRDGLVVGHERLAAVDPRTDAALARAIAELPLMRASGKPAMRTIAVPRRGGGAPYLVQAIAVGGVEVHARGVLLVVTDPTVGTPDAALLQRLLGLTPAEAALATELATGVTLTAAAMRRGIGIETARTQLKAVLGKAGCAGQAELARLLSRLGTDEKL